MRTVKPVTPNTPLYPASETAPPCFTAVEDGFGWHIRHNGSVIKTGLNEKSAKVMADLLNKALDHA